MTIIFDGTQGITTPAETANNSVTTPIVKSSANLVFQTNGSTEAMRIDTSQNVGIGTSSPQMRVDVSGGVRVQSITNPSSGSGMELAYDGTQGIIQAYSNRATLTSVPVYLVTGQLRFPPTQNPSSNANTLDDYEEGTWTPVDASGAGLTLGINSTYYIKVGRTVTIFAYFSYPSNSNGNVATIGGAPFAATGYAEIFMRTTANLTATIWQIGENTTSGSVHLSNNNATLTNAQLSGATFLFTGVYIANT